MSISTASDGTIYLYLQDTKMNYLGGIKLDDVNTDYFHNNYSTKV